MTAASTCCAYPFARNLYRKRLEMSKQNERERSLRASSLNAKPPAPLVRDIVWRRRQRRSVTSGTNRYLTFGSLMHIHDRRCPHGFRISRQRVNILQFPCSAVTCPCVKQTQPQSIGRRCAVVTAATDLIRADHATTHYSCS